MTTNRQPPNVTPRKVSLRELSRQVGVTHGSLSAAVRDGRLTHGVRLDERGRVVVIDADAAAADWRDVHTPNPLEESRARESARRVVAAMRPEDIVLMDVALDRQVTARQLFEECAAFSLLVTALTAEVYGDDHRNAAGARAELKKRIAVRLHDVAELHGADDDCIERAEGDLACALAMLADKADDDEART